MNQTTYNMCFFMNNCLILGDMPGLDSILPVYTIENSAITIYKLTTMARIEL